MAGLGSPRVQTTRIDQSFLVEESVGSTGVLIGNFNKGRVGERLFIANQRQAEQILGTPTIDNPDEAYYTMNAFLERSNQLWVQRVLGDNALYGGIDVGTSRTWQMTPTDPAVPGDPIVEYTITIGRALPGTLTFWLDTGEKVAFDNPDSATEFTGILQGDRLDGAAVPPANTVDYRTGTINLTFEADQAPPSGSVLYVRMTPVQPYEWSVGKEDPAAYDFTGPVLSMRLSQHEVDINSHPVISDTLPFADIPDVLPAPAVPKPHGGIGNAFALYDVNGLVPVAVGNGESYVPITEPEQYHQIATDEIGENVTTLAFWAYRYSTDTYAYLGHYDPNETGGLYDAGIAGDGYFLTSAEGAENDPDVTTALADGTFQFTLNEASTDWATNLGGPAPTPAEFDPDVPAYDIAIIASWVSQESLSMVAYADNQGSWADGYEVTIDGQQLTDVGGDVARPEFDVLVEQPQANGSRLQIYLQTTTRQRDAISEDTGTSVFTEDLINDNNDFLRVLDNPNLPAGEITDMVNGPINFPSSFLDHTENDVANTEPIVMAGGDQGDEPTDAEYILALQDFDNKEDIDIDIVMDTRGTVPYQNAIIRLCDRRLGGRGDCFGVLHIPFDVEQNSQYAREAVNYRRYSLATSTDSASLHFGWVEIFDPFTARTVLAPPTGWIAAIMSFTSSSTEDWYVPAGWNRGTVAVDDLFRRLLQGERDLLYDNGINIWKFTPGRGIAAWGNKTLYGRASSLESINVVRGLIQIENNIERAMENFVFEFNDDITRNNVQGIIADYLESVRIRRGLYDYRVVCDTSNNGPQEINNKILRVDYYLAVIRGIEYIRVRSIVVKFGDL